MIHNDTPMPRYKPGRLRLHSGFGGMWHRVASTNSESDKMGLMDMQKKTSKSTQRQKLNRLNPGPESLNPFFDRAVVIFSICFLKK